MTSFARRTFGSCLRHCACCRVISRQESACPHISSYIVLLSAETNLPVTFLQARSYSWVSECKIGNTWLKISPSRSHPVLFLTISTQLFISSRYLKWKRDRSMWATTDPWRYFDYVWNVLAHFLSSCFSFYLQIFHQVLERHCTKKGIFYSQALGAPRWYDSSICTEKGTMPVEGKQLPGHTSVNSCIYKSTYFFFYLKCKMCVLSSQWRFYEKYLHNTMALQPPD